MNLNDIKIGPVGGVSVEQMAEGFKIFAKYVSDQLEDAKQNAHPTYNDPAEYTLHLTEEQAQALVDLLYHVGGEKHTRRKYISVIIDELEDAGVEPSEDLSDIHYGHKDGIYFL
jgi:hypothetical protein